MEESRRGDCREAVFPDPIRRKGLRARPGRRGGIPPETAKALRCNLRLYLEHLGVAITAPVFGPGASEIGSAEGEAYEVGYKIYEAVRALFGRGYTKEQILAVVWPELQNLAPWARKRLGLPQRRSEVTSWVWHLRDGGDGF